MEQRNTIMRSLIFLAFTVQLSSAASHSLHYFYTGVTPGISFPEFSLVGLLDGEQIVYYDSDTREMIPKTDWMKKSDDPDYWVRNTQRAQGSEEDFKASLQIAMQRYNHTGGVHTVQWMYGCELDDDETKRGYDQYSYDGEDFLSLDLNTGTWTAPNPQAFPTKKKLDDIQTSNYVKTYLENTCIEWLQKYMEYGRSSLERNVHPEVSLFQKDSSSPVVCHATGFFPKALMIYWQKNGEDVHDDVELRETLPNQDGTFQKRSILTVSPEEMKGNEYTCVIQHAGLKEELRLSEIRVLPDEGSVGLIIGVVVVVLLLVVIGCVGVFVWKKKSGFKPVSQTASEGDSSSNNSK